MTAAVKGEDVMQGVLNGAADGFMSGAITGAITGGMQGAASFMKSSKMMGSLDEASQLAKKPKTSPRCAKDCFVAGTMVKTEGGYKAIEEIEVGDKVWSWDEATGEQALKTVVQLFRNEKDVLVHIDAAGEHIQTTLGHPFYVAGKGWVKAGELKSGDVLKLYDGKEAEINSVSIKESKPVITYNFEVEDSHTYYVTQSDVLCHNMCAQTPKAPKSPKLMKEPYLKKNGIDPHAFKNEFIDKTKIARYDIYLDTADDMLWLGSKHHPTVWIETFTKFTRS